MKVSNAEYLQIEWQLGLKRQNLIIDVNTLREIIINIPIHEWNRNLMKNK